MEYTSEGSKDAKNAVIWRISDEFVHFLFKLILTNGFCD